MQAIKDYQNPKYKEEVERFILSDNIYTDYIIPNLSKSDILQGVKNYGKKEN